MAVIKTSKKSTSSAAFDRVATGVPGFDKLIQGGLIKGSTYLVAGQAGTGKSIFSMQYILEGLRNGENCVYLSLEQKVKEVLGDMMNFEWGIELKKFYDEKKLLIASADPSNVKELQEVSLAYISKTKATRFVLDSLTVVAFGWKISSMDMGKIRSEIFGFIKSVENIGVTSVLISEIPESEIKKLSMFGFEEFIVDGVVVLHYLDYSAGGAPRNLMIRKMRRTDHGTDIYPFQINKKGFVIKNS